MSYGLNNNAADCTCSHKEKINKFFEHHDAEQLNEDLNNAFLLALSSPEFDRLTPANRARMAETIHRTSKLIDMLQAAIADPPKNATRPEPHRQPAMS